MKKLLLLLLVLSLLLFVGCGSEQPVPRDGPSPPKYVPPAKENVTIPIVPEEVLPPVEENVTPTEPEEVILPVEENITPTEPEEVIPLENLTEPYIFSKDTFFTDVIVDLESFNPSVEEIEEVMEIASFKFKQLTGYNLELRDIFYLSKISGIEDISGSYKDSIQYKSLLNNNQGLNGVIVLTKEFGTEGPGGYSTAYYYSDYCNSFKSLAYNYETVYFSYQDWDHKYAICGYNNGEHVSTVSIGGECKNQPGTLCVFNGNYYICENFQEDYYAQENALVACTIVHEFMHPFGENGNYDHYGTAICNEAMGTTSADYSSEEFQYYCGMCPNVYENFKNSFVQC